MFPEEIKQLKTGNRELRKFALTVGGVLLFLGFLFLSRHKDHYRYFLYPGAVLIVLGSLVPRILKHVYLAWMTLGLFLGFIVSTLLLFFFFYLVVSPIGLLARFFGKDFLARRWDPAAPSYWIQRDRSKTRAAAQYEQQF